MLSGKFFILLPINLLNKAYENEVMFCECPNCKTDCFFTKKDVQAAILIKANPTVQCLLCADGFEWWKAYNKDGTRMTKQPSNVMPAKLRHKDTASKPQAFSNKKHITHKISMPRKMKKQLDIANFIQQRAEMNDLTPYEQAVMKRHANLIREFNMSKFMFDGLNKPYAEKLKYCHRAEALIDKKLIWLVRNSTPEPDIFEKFLTNFKIRDNQG